MQELPKLFLPTKEMLESEIASLRTENKRLEAEKEQIHKDRQALQSRVSELEKNNAHLWQEVERLGEEKSETDRLQPDRLLLEVEKLEGINEENLIELRDLRSERYDLRVERYELLEEKKEREKKFESMVEESTSIVLRMLEVQKDLEEKLERRKELAQTDLEEKLERRKELAQTDLEEKLERRKELPQTNLEECLERREEFAVEKDGKKRKRASSGLEGAAKMVRSLIGGWMRIRS